MLIVHRAIRSVSHWGSVFSSPRAAPCMSSIPWIPTAMQRLYFLWKYSPAPLAMAFRTHEIPEQPGQPEKALDHVTVWKSLGRQQEITHTLAEVDLITKQAIWTAWLMVGSQASGKGAHVSPSGQGSHGDAGQGTHTQGEHFLRPTQHSSSTTAHSSQLHKQLQHWAQEKGDTPASAAKWPWHRKGSHTEADHHWHQKKGRGAASVGLPCHQCHWDALQSSWQLVLQPELGTGQRVRAQEHSIILKVPVTFSPLTLPRGQK